VGLKMALRVWESAKGRRIFMEYIVKRNKGLKKFD